MITSVVGRLIKKPEQVERIHIPGKRVVAFTIVQNSQRGDKRLSVFFNLTMIVATEAQFEMVMRLEKGTVLLFSSPRITYVKQVDKDEHEQVINLYAEIDNFRIVAGAQGMTGDAPASPHPADAAAFEETEEAPPSQAPPQQRRPVPPTAGAAPNRTAARPMPAARTGGAPPGLIREDAFDSYGEDETSFPDHAELSDPFADADKPPASSIRPTSPRPAATTTPPAVPTRRAPSARNAPRAQRPVPEDQEEQDDPFA